MVLSIQSGGFRAIAYTTCTAAAVSDIWLFHSAVPYICGVPISIVTHLPLVFGVQLLMVLTWSVMAVPGLHLDFTRGPIQDYTGRWGRVLPVNIGIFTFPCTLALDARPLVAAVAIMTVCNCGQNLEVLGGLERCLPTGQYT